MPPTDNLTHTTDPVIDALVNQLAREMGTSENQFETTSGDLRQLLRFTFGIIQKLSFPSLTKKAQPQLRASGDVKQTDANPADAKQSVPQQPQQPQPALSINKRKRNPDKRGSPIVAFYPAVPAGAPAPPIPWVMPMAQIVLAPAPPAYDDSPPTYEEALELMKAEQQAWCTNPTRQLMC
jgi:hypothetical protein